MSDANSTKFQGETQYGSQLLSHSRKLWLYTNFDCNLWCTYCVAESSPKTPRRALSIETVRRLVDEAEPLGFYRLYFTGGEPFFLEEIYEMLAYSSSRLKTTVLTNAMLFRGKRLPRLCEINNDNLSVQISLDGARAEVHDAYRGEGSWGKTVDGIRLLLSNDFHVCISTTETPANTPYMDEIRDFIGELGIAEGDHFIRPLARRGFSQEGLDVGVDNLLPEVTISADGVYWHPLVSPSDGDMLITRRIFPLAKAVECIQKQLESQNDEQGAERTEVQ